MSDHLVARLKKDLFSLSDEMSEFCDKIKGGEKRIDDYNEFFKNPYKKNKDGSLYYNLPYTEEIIVEREIIPEKKNLIEPVSNNLLTENKSPFYQFFHNSIKTIQKLFNKKKKVSSLESLVVEKEIEEVKPIIEKKTILQEKNYLTEINDDKSFIMELVRYLEENNSFVLKNSKGEVLTGEYSGPQIKIYPDSNILISNASKDYKGFIKKLSDSSPSLVKDELGIIIKESYHGGFKNKDISNCSKTILGENPFLKRYPVDCVQGKSSSQLFKIINEFYDNEVNSISNFVDRNTLQMSYNAIKGNCEDAFNSFLGRAEDYLSEIKTEGKSPISRYLNHEDYKRWVAKTMMNICKNCKDNYRADKIITSTTMALNLVDEKNKHLIISADSDIGFYMDTFVKEIIPEYISESIIDILEKNHRKPSEFHVKALSEAVRGMYNLNMDDSNGQKLTLGLFYNPHIKELRKIEHS